MSAHKRMTRSQRAKQFMPFAALKGYEEALRRAEEEHRIKWEEKGETPQAEHAADKP